jgi:hypothetical protein
MRPRARLRVCNDQLLAARTAQRRGYAGRLGPLLAAGLCGCALLVAVGLVTISYKVTRPSPTAGAHAAIRHDPARVQVSASEFQLVLSRASIKAGPAIVELVNRGEDEHDLALRRIGPGATTRRLKVVGPGGVAELSARLRAGRFVLWCTLADHRARGMRATLIVR